MAETKDPKVPMRTLTLDVPDPITIGERIAFSAIAIMKIDAKPFKDLEVVFYLQGQQIGSVRTNENGRAQFPFTINVNIQADKLLVEVICEGERTTKEVALPKKQEPKPPLIADQLIPRAEGKDGRHSLYLAVVTQDKKPIPDLHVIVKDSMGRTVTQGTTREKGVVEPHPFITLSTPGLHHFTIYVEGTALKPQPLELDGPPRYPRPPQPPQTIPLDEREYIGRNPFKAVYMGWRVGRRALREQREQGGSR